MLGIHADVLVDNPRRWCLLTSHRSLSLIAHRRLQDKCHGTHWTRSFRWEDEEGASILLLFHLRIVHPARCPKRLIHEMEIKNAGSSSVPKRKHRTSNPSASASASSASSPSHIKLLAVYVQHPCTSKGVF